MRRCAGGRLAVTSALSVVLALGTLAGTASGVPGRSAATGSAADGAELPRPARGADAVRLLGDGLDEAAARNDMTAAELSDLLTTDTSAWVDANGAVFFEEATAPAPADDPVSAQAPLSETFELHSNPGSARTIFLDFDGGTVSGTAWHSKAPALPTTQPAWDTGGDAAVFDDAERTAIQTIWRAVAEDYAPFDVDVTTADPGPGGIRRSGALDLTYGARVLVTASTAVHDALCSGGCGGVAYLGVFDQVTSAGGDGYGYYQPAWVFPHKLGNSPKNIAEAASHEVGHNFGLSHDGNATQGYDSGHGAWAPIMGNGYGRPISQWSKGDYTGATQQEDDVAVIRSVAGSRPDEAPATVLAAPTVPAGTAYVGSRTDVDTYLLGTCSGAVSVAAAPLASFADLDLRLTILDGLGQVVATDDPASSQTTSSTAAGMGASLTRILASGTYYASVDGVGNGPWSTGYDDYGSLGSYTLAATGCTGVAGPGLTTTSLAAAATGRTVTLTASPATLVGTLLGDVVFREGSTVVATKSLGTGSPAATLTDVTPGVHTYTATFVPLGVTHLGSTSPAQTVTVARVATTTDLATWSSAAGLTLASTVASGSGVPAGAVELRDGGTLVGTVPLSGGAGSLTLADVAAGDHTYTATYVPGGTFHAASTSPARTQRVEAPTVPPTTPSQPTPVPTPTPYLAPSPPAAPALSTSTTTVRAPTRASAGTRPTVTVTVARGASPATGTVVIAVGTWSRTVVLRSGTARVRLPRLTGSKTRVAARYLGDATTSASAARRTIKVVG